MKFCSTCLSSCFPPPSILENSQDKKPVVSGALVFVQQDSLTQSDGYDAVNATQIPTNISPVNMLVFVNPAKISPPKNSELYQRPISTNQLVEFQPLVQEDQAQAQALVVQERFQLPIPIKEAPRQFQSTILTQEAQMFNQQQYWGQSVWDIPPSTSATPLPYEQINFETSKEPSPPPEQIVFGAGFMPIRRRDGVPSSMDGVEISQSPSRVDNSIQNESRYPSPTPSPEAPSGGDKAVRYLLV